MNINSPSPPALSPSIDLGSTWACSGAQELHASSPCRREIMRRCSGDDDRQVVRFVEVPDPGCSRSTSRPSRTTQVALRGWHPPVISPVHPRPSSRWTGCCPEGGGHLHLTLADDVERSPQLALVTDVLAHLPPSLLQELEEDVEAGPLQIVKDRDAAEEVAIEASRLAIMT